MEPSQLGGWVEEEGDIEVRTVDVWPYVGWTEGMFVFSDERLEDMMETLSRWYNVEVAWEDEGLRGLHFTGSLRRYEDIDRILGPIGSAVGARFSIEGRTVRVAR